MHHIADTAFALMGVGAVAVMANDLRRYWRRAAQALRSLDMEGLGK